MRLLLLHSYLAMILVPLTIAQDLSKLPSCASKAALTSLSSTGCQLTDFACICKDSAFINKLTPIVEKDCSASDIKKVAAITVQLCANAGVTINTSTFATVAPFTSASTQMTMQGTTSEEASLSTDSVTAHSSTTGAAIQMTAQGSTSEEASLSTDSATTHPGTTGTSTQMTAQGTTSKEASQSTNSATTHSLTTTRAPSINRTSSSFRGSSVAPSTSIKAFTSMSDTLNFAP